MDFCTLGCVFVEQRSELQRKGRAERYSFFLSFLLNERVSSFILAGVAPECAVTRANHDRLRFSRDHSAGHKANVRLIEQVGCAGRLTSTGDQRARHAQQTVALHHGIFREEVRTIDLQMAFTLDQPTVCRNNGIRL